MYELRPCLVRQPVVFLEFQLADLVAVNLVGTVGQADGAGVGVTVGEREVVRHAAAAMSLSSVSVIANALRLRSVRL